MHFRLYQLIVPFVALTGVLLSNCGGIYKPGSVSGFDAKHHVVQTFAGGGYRVGRLPSDWSRQKIKARAVLFEHLDGSATITVSSWCKSAYSESTLYEMDREIYHGLKNFSILDQSLVRSGEYMTKRTAVRGQIDSKGVYLKSMVYKVNDCVIDFVFVARPDGEQHVADFDAFAGGFEFLRGPKIL